MRCVDDPLMQLIFGENDAYPDAEERRRLYLAPTRARRRVIVLAYDGPDLVFPRELSGGEYGRWVELIDLLAESGRPARPGCRDGRLVVRSGRMGRSIRCTNFPHCLHKQKVGAL